MTHQTVTGYPFERDSVSGYGYSVEDARERRLFAAINALHSEVSELVRARVADLMREHGENPENERLFGLRCAQVVSGLPREFERLAGV